MIPLSSKIRLLWSRWRVDIFVFLVAWIVLLSVTLYAYSTGRLMPSGGAIGAYLGYDNYFRFETGGGAWDASHPLFNLLYFINRRLIVPLCGESATLLICLLFTSLCTSVGVAATYSYLKRVVSLPIGRSVLLSGLLLSSFTVLTISFTIESYPISFALLTLSIFSLSRELMLYKRCRPGTLSIWSFVLGGVTLTNFAKPLAIVFLEQESWRKKCIKVFIPSMTLALAIIAVGLWYHQRSNSTEALPSESSSMSEQVVDLLRFQKRGDAPLQQFFGHPVLIGRLAPRLENQEVTIRPSHYNYAVSYIVPIVVVLSILAMGVVGSPHRIAWLLPLYLSVDIAVHWIGGYGMNEAVIFGGHWIFLFPMALGWIYRRLPQRAVVWVDLLVGASAVLLLVHNVMSIPTLLS